MAGNNSSRELRSALAGCRGALLGVGAISGLVNVLALTGSFFMLEVYDRVIPSRSIPTLVGLGVLALALFAFQGLLEALRSRLLARVGATLDAELGARVFVLSAESPLRGAQAGEGHLMLRDLDTLRGFLVGSGLPALFDLPWLPLYVAICFLFHPLLGTAAVVGALVIAALALASEGLTREPTERSTALSMARHGLAEAARRNVEAVAAMGLFDRLADRWSEANREYVATQQRVADLAGGLGAASKIWRLVLQSGVLALGAWLVIEGKASSGIIIASSILVSRALAPAELAVANWKGFVAARQSWRRLSVLLGRVPPAQRRHPLPAPCRTLTAEGLTVAPPGQMRPVLRGVSLQLRAGQALGVIGPSASGKSTLVRALTGVWTPAGGSVRLDGAALDQWSRTDLGPHIGYLPQEAELFAGTIADNIARFDPRFDGEDVIAAARAAGVHELILQLPQGYSTRLGEAGAGLSAGQRQRVGLARALYGDPFLVVLDEPNANLDLEGETALTQAILGVRARGGVCVVVAHRPSALAAIDLVLMMADGQAQAFGPKDEILKGLMRPTPVAPRKRASGSASVVAARAAAEPSVAPLQASVR